MKEMKYSRQRESIREFLLSRKDHPSAEEIYQNVRRTYPNISLGTVYRNLSLLTATGAIQKISCGDTCERTDLELPDLSFMNILAGSSFQGRIEGSFTYFYGLCESCMDKGVDRT